MGRKKTQYPIVEALEKAGIDVAQFATEKLGYSYQAFRYHLRHNNNWSLDHYHLIMHYTGKTFEQLWPSPYEFNRQPVQLNLKSKSKPVITYPPKEKSQEPDFVPVPPPSKVDKPQPNSVFELVDIYDGGLPVTEDSSQF